QRRDALRNAEERWKLERAQLVERRLGDLQRRPAHAHAVLVVKDDDLTARAAAHVELDAVDVVLERDPERGYRVIRRLETRAAMREDQRPSFDRRQRASREMKPERPRQRMFHRMPERARRRAP